MQEATPDPSSSVPRAITSRRFLWTAFVLLFVLTRPGGAGVQQWSQIGPYGADVRMLAMDPDAPSNLVAATEQGLYTSTDAGASWQYADIPPRYVRSLVAGPSIFYATMSDPDDMAPTLWKSVDDGVSWSVVPGELLDGERWLVQAVDPMNPSVLYASRPDVGLAKSTDGGLTWSPFAAELGELDVRKLVVAPSDSSAILLAATMALRSDLFRSADGGQTWQTISETFPPEVLRHSGALREIAVDPRDPSNIYVIARQFGTSFDALYRSIDGGQSWRLMGEGGDGTSCRRHHLVVAPTGGPTVYYGNRCAFAWSLDGGENWSPAASGLENTSITSLAVDPLGSSTLYVGTYSGEGTIGGVLRSTDGGRSWAPRRHGFGPRPVSDLVIDPADPEKIYTATYASDPQILRSADGGRTWEASFTYGLRAVDHLIIDPEDSNILHGSMDARGGGIVRSADGGETWEWVFGDLFTFPQSLELDQVDPNFVYAGTNQGFMRSVDRGLTWQAVGADFGNVRVLTVDPTTRNVYASTFSFPERHYLLHRSTDQGVTWTILAEGLPRIISLAVDPSEPTRLYAGTQENGVLRSLDGGFTWSASFDRDLSVAALAIDPVRPSVVYAGTRVGVWRSADGGDSWEPLERDSLGRVSAVSLAFDPTNTDILYAAGLGISQIEVVDTSVALQDGRFEIEIEWTDFQNREGVGKVAVVPAEEPQEVDLRSRDSTVLQFFSPDNWELLFKVLDGRAINDHFWVYFAAATDVGYTVSVTDTSCGETRTYVNPLGMAARAVTDETAFASCDQPQPPLCEADEDTFCLGEDDRFEVEVTWTNFGGVTGMARQARLERAGRAASRDTGLFYFFTKDNWELLVKVLDGCDINGHFWLFAAATTDVGYRLKVTDTANGVSSTLVNPVGLAAPAVTNIQAFATCDL